jgi:TonB family protein
MRSAFLGVLALTLLWPLLPSWQMNWPDFLANGWNATIAVLRPQVVSPVDSTVAATSIHWPVWLLCFWLTGCMIAGTRYLLGILSAIKLARTATRVDQPELTHAAERIAHELDLRRPVRILINEQLSIPIVFGLWRATILLPANASEWTPECRDLVLRHELAHVRRRDHSWIHLATLASILHWFNPLVWAAKGKMVAESEYACDDSVLEIGASSSDYAQHLLDCAREAGRLDRSVRAGVALAYNTQLEGRIMSILADRTRAAFTTVKLTAVVTAVMLALALPMVGLSWDAKAGEALPGPDDFVQVETYPEMTYDGAPVYPEKAKKAGIEGIVWVKSLVGKKGVVLDVQLAKTSGQKMLDESALKAAWKCKFTPATINMKPVAVWVPYVVSFVLEDKKETEK